MDDDDDVGLNVSDVRLTYWGQITMDDDDDVGLNVSDVGLTYY